MAELQNIKLIVSDVDGVWTDGRIIYAGDSREIKEFNVRDGLGVKIAQKSGLEIAVITSRSSKALERRCRELSIRHLEQSARNKLEAMDHILGLLDLDRSQAAYLGDDLPDLPAIEVAGLSAAPADAAAEVLAAVTWPLHSRGGNGVVREFVEKFFRERGDWEDLIHEFRSGSVVSGRL